MLTVRQVKVDALASQKENILKKVAQKLKVPVSDIKKFSIMKQSIDARNKNEIFYVYEINVDIDNEEKILKKEKGQDVSLARDLAYNFEKSGEIKLVAPPVVVGSGPAGLFCAYVLAENGYNPIVVERGEDVDSRIKAVNEFWKTGKLNKNSNVQFGEGGAGTFSDGKLNTLVKDEGNRCRKVLETFVKFGAPDEILYSQKPHIGTDVLSSVIKNMREQIKKMGGSFLYNSCMTDLIVENNSVKGIKINGEKIIECSALILAIGHSARDTFEMIYNHNVEMSAKPFAVGIRVQHNQDMINLSQYGEKYKDVLPNATYKLTYKSTDGRGVYSFCMCPGGYVVNASSEEGRLAVNGMSYNDRNGENANSAIIVTVTPDDFGSGALDGVEFQRSLEEKAYKTGNGNIPTQTLDDFKNGEVTTELGGVNPVFKGDYTFADLNKILPEKVGVALKESFDYFGRKIKGFDNGDTLLSAIESRTSSPVKIFRNENGESNISGLYPCGEGAGYAGGIMTAAVDGIKTAESIMKED